MLYLIVNIPFSPRSRLKEEEYMSKKNGHYLVAYDLVLRTPKRMYI